MEALTRIVLISTLFLPVAGCRNVEAPSISVGVAQQLLEFLQEVDLQSPIRIWPQWQRRVQFAGFVDEKSYHELFADERYVDYILNSSPFTSILLYGYTRNQDGSISHPRVDHISLPESYLQDLQKSAEQVSDQAVCGQYVSYGSENWIAGSLVLVDVNALPPPAISECIVHSLDVVNGLFNFPNSAVAALGSEEKGALLDIIYWCAETAQSSLPDPGRTNAGLTEAPSRGCIEDVLNTTLQPL